MKKLFTYIIVITALAGCKGMLDEEPYGLSTSEEMLKDKNNLVSIVGQAYADLQWIVEQKEYYGIALCTTDEGIMPRRAGGDWDDNGFWKNMNTHNWQPTDQCFEGVWGHNNAGAVLCNQILQQIAGEKELIDPAVYNQYTAELVTLRSYYYYMLFDCFGRIPYTEKVDDGVTPQSDVDVVWHKLVKALEDHVQYLPEEVNEDTYGRCTKWMAYALLAKLYLNAASFGVTEAGCYNKCVECCDKIINSGKYQLEDNFFTNFLVNNEGSKENIFVIPFDGAKSFNYLSSPYGGGHNKLRIMQLSLKYGFQQCWDLIQTPYNGACARPAYINRFKTDDGHGNVRLFVDRRGPCDSTLATGGTNIDFDAEPWGWFLGPIIDIKTGKPYIMDDHDNEPSVVVNTISSLDVALYSEGACLMKFQYDKNPSTHKEFMDNDFPVFRLSDVIYMKAESILRGATNGGTIAQMVADPDFQKIRTRVGCLPYTVAQFTLDELCDERGRELAWENHRRRDLIRFGKFNNPAYVEFITNTDVTRNWFPIPAKMIETSGNVWTQNAGY